MFEGRNLERWHRAGLLDDGARRRILDWERAQARPVWLWAMAGIGVIAILFGIVALIAANWVDIPGWVKVAGQLCLNLVAAIALFLAWRAGGRWLQELLALLLFGLTLAGIGLIGQVYQLGGEPWQAVLVWMAVCTPFLIVLTRSGLLAVAWALGALAAFALAAAALIDLDETWMALTLLPGVGLLGLGVLRGWMPGGDSQGAWIKGLAVAIVLASACLPQLLVWTHAMGTNPPWQGGTVVMATLAVLTLLAFDAHRRGRWDVMGLVIVPGSCVVWLLTALERPAGQLGGLQDRALVTAAIIFVVFWALVAWAALRSGQRGLFAASFAIVALRIAILYWEALGSLLSTGLGLVLGGALCIALAALGWYVARQFRARRALP